MSIRIEVSATTSQGWWHLSVDGVKEVARLRRVREAIIDAGDDAEVTWPPDLAAALERVAASDDAALAARRESEEARLGVVDLLIGDGPRPIENDADVGAALGVSRQRAAQLRQTLQQRRGQGGNR